MDSLLLIHYFFIQMKTWLYWPIKRQNDVIFISDDTKSSLSPGCSRKKIEEKSDGDGSIQSALDAVMGKYIFIFYDLTLLQPVIQCYKILSYHDHIWNVKYTLLNFKSNENTSRKRVYKMIWFIDGLCKCEIMINEKKRG